MSLNFHVAFYNSFELSQSDRAQCSVYYRLHWQLSYLMHKLNDDGTLTHAGVNYLPIWKDEFVRLQPEKQMKLSFRSHEGLDIVLIRSL